MSNSFYNCQVFVNPFFIKAKIVWTNADLIPWCIYATLGWDELIKSSAHSGWKGILTKVLNGIWLKFNF